MKPLPRLLLFLVLMNGFMLASLPSVKPLLFFPITAFRPLISLELSSTITFDFRQFEFFAAISIFVASTILTKIFKPDRLLMLTPPFLGFIVYLMTGITYAVKTQDSLLKAVLFLVVTLFLFQAIPWWFGYFLGTKLNSVRSRLE